VIPLMQAGPSRREGKRGGGGGNGLRVLQAGLSRYRRIRSTTRGSVMKETIFISAPHLQSKRSTSKERFSYCISCSRCDAWFSRFGR